MFNPNRLLSVALLFGDSTTSLAKKIGIAFFDWKKRLDGERDFRLKELYKIKKLYNLTPQDMDDIFFSQYKDE